MSAYAAGHHLEDGPGRAGAHAARAAGRGMVTVSTNWCRPPVAGFRIWVAGVRPVGTPHRPVAGSWNRAVLGWDPLAAGRDSPTLSAVGLADAVISRAPVGSVRGHEMLHREDRTVAPVGRGGPVVWDEVVARPQTDRCRGLFDRL